jgi:hypothetical protein
MLGKGSGRNVAESALWHAAAPCPLCAPFGGLQARAGKKREDRLALPMKMIGQSFVASRAIMSSEYLVQPDFQPPTSHRQAHLADFASVPTMAQGDREPQASIRPSDAKEEDRYSYAFDSFQWADFLDHECPVIVRKLLRSREMRSRSRIAFKCGPRKYARRLVGKRNPSASAIS